MEKAYQTHSAEETKALAKKLAENIRPGTVLCLSGDLGAGKTTFTQGILESLGAEGPFVSPTFVIMKQYDLKEAPLSGIRRIYHADAYRVGEKDFALLGFQEWAEDPEGLVILEWPERIANLLPDSRQEVFLEQKSGSERLIRVVEK